MDKRLLRVLFFLIFCVFLAGVAWYGVRWVEKIPQRVATATEAMLQKKALQLRAQFFSIARFQPKVRVNQKVISETTSEIAEISVLEKQIEVVREFNHTWAGSTKMLRLSGVYSVKSGFNLLDRFEIQMDQKHRRVLLPPAAILSIEQKQLKVEALQNGFWNPISADDLENSVASLKELARSRSQGLLQQTEGEFTKRLQSLMDAEVEIVPIRP